MLDRPSDGAGSVEAVFMAPPRLVSGQPLPMQDELFLHGRDGAWGTVTSTPHPPSGGRAPDIVHASARPVTMEGVITTLLRRR